MLGMTSPNCCKLWPSSDAHGYSQVAGRVYTSLSSFAVCRDLDSPVFTFAMLAGYAMQVS